jgi:hypothetical protein
MFTELMNARAEVERLRIAHGEAMLVVETVEVQLGRARAEIARLHALIDERHCCWWEPDGTGRAICPRCGDYVRQAWEEQ